MPGGPNPVNSSLRMHIQSSQNIANVAPNRNSNGAQNANLNPALVQAGQLRGPDQVNRMSFASKLCAKIVHVGLSALEAIVNKFNSLKEKYYAYKNREPSELFATKVMRFEIPGIENQVVWTGRDFKDIISAAPKSERSNLIDKLPGIIQERLKNGAKIYEQLKNTEVYPTDLKHQTDLKEALPEPTVQNVSDLTIYLYAKATAQGDKFLQGSFNISDPKGNLAFWLSDSREMYLRSSTHLEEVQYENVKDKFGNEIINTQCGIDIPKTAKTGLPINFKTITFGTIPPLGENRERRLFLKAESFGCRFMFNLFRLNGLKSRPIRAYDFGHFLGHTFSFFFTRGQQGDTTKRKEHFPKSISNVLKKYKSYESKEIFSDILNCDCKKSGYGIRILWSKLTEAYKHLEPSSDPKLKPFLDELYQAIQALPHKDHLNIRLGNEVIID